MTVVEVLAFGSASNLVTGERPVPLPAPDEILVKVAAAGVNRADVMQRSGKYPPPPGASDLLGLEISGTVVCVGSNVSNWIVGDKVCGLVSGGGYAQYCKVPATQCLPIPEGLDLIDSAALPEACCTVWTNVFERGKLDAGETFLVHGGSSGIGTTAIQLARLAGARVFTTAGSLDKCKACEQLGAEFAINYRKEDFASVIKNATNGCGVDLILDIVGGAYLRRNLEILADDGRLVLIGLMGGVIEEINLGTLMSRRLLLTGSTLRSRSMVSKGAIVSAVRKEVWPHVVAKRFAPVVHKRFQMDAVVEAHHLMESSTHIGKLLLVV